jgi:hypothetical protein
MDLAKTGSRIGRGLRDNKLYAVLSSVGFLGFWGAFSEYFNGTSILETLLGPYWFQIMTSPLVVHLLGLAGIAASIFCLWRIGSNVKQGEPDSPLSRTWRVIALQNSYQAGLRKAVDMASFARSLRQQCVSARDRIELIRERGEMVGYIEDANLSLEMIKSDLWEVSAIQGGPAFSEPFPDFVWKRKADGAKSYSLADNGEYLTALEGLLSHVKAHAKRLEDCAEEARADLPDIAQIRLLTEKLSDDR